MKCTPQSCVILSILVGFVNAWSSRQVNVKSTSLSAVSRRSILSSATITTIVAAGLQPANAGDDEESFSSIAARAAKMSKERESEGSNTPSAATSGNKPSQIAYDFKLPVAGEKVSFGDIVRQDEERERVKAILVINMKQDDPIARKDIPELISMAARYGKNGEFVVLLSPTDQGYYEPDTSALIRLKLASEYGYGINPATTLTDKMNLLGTGADPFWRWLEGSCRTPAGLGRIEGNFEKFLLDGRTGLPVRRYPRKYMPYDIRDDIEALLAGRPIPPAGANFREEWRMAANDAERDTYRFQKGLNVFDQ
mmetsp:Transcript_10827/g.16636  ORF Transcript_10827/g.16636 Transcript_10827/m.16636 type:complete len:310 (+) Transcript_10827:159-1088(+)|eukprot:CAMPEP_0178917566 /NCGR_PEP_ID=MMETSP0786-20121207/13318_1 /TAXON_ID=186022 /ORGANISM="Thalassionema frauenfeldii, Strain CCMP 1798" /LENGTH=309 /DNA_ID=CAMNT_0020591131 /DNA_START=142 /DNA_END=1071 /DNA_ORIENTATION=+